VSDINHGPPLQTVAPMKSKRTDRHTAPESKCKSCSKPVIGRQTYCSDRCRQRARKSLSGPIQRRGQNREISRSQPTVSIEEFRPTFAISEIVSLERSRPKTVQASAYKHLELEKVNASTWKVVDPKLKTDIPAKLGHWAGYRTTRALVWVIDLGYGQWIARCGNEVCNPTNLADAKRQALAMAVGGVGDYQVSDPISEFNQLSAIIEDRYAAEFLVNEDDPIVVTECHVTSCDEPELEYYPDGYPMLPAFLDRRRT
jgi:hypothetical protein